MIDVAGNLLKIDFYGMRFSLRIIFLILALASFLVLLVINYKRIKNRSLIISVICFGFYFFVMARLSVIYYGFNAVFETIRSFFVAFILCFTYLVINFTKRELFILRILFYVLSGIVSFLCIFIFLIGKMNLFGITNIYEFCSLINNALSCRVFVPRPNGGGIYCSLQLMVMICIFYQSYRLFYHKQYSLIPLALLNCLCILQSMTRTYFASLLVYVIVMIFGLLIKNRFNKKTIILSSAVFLSLLTIIILFGRKRLFSMDEPGTEKRLEYLLLSKDLFLNGQILFGYGFGVFKHKLGYALLETEPLQLLIQFGITGLSLLSCCIYKWLCEIKKIMNKRIQFFVFIGILISLVFGSCFNPILFNSNGVALVGIIFYFLVFDSSSDLESCQE